MLSARGPEAVRRRVCPRRFPTNKKSREKPRVNPQVGKSLRPVMLAPIPMPILLTERAAPRRAASLQVRGRASPKEEVSAGGRASHEEGASEEREAGEASTLQSQEESWDGENARSFQARLPFHK